MGRHPSQGHPASLQPPARPLDHRQRWPSHRRQRASRPPTLLPTRSRRALRSHRQIHLRRPAQRPKRLRPVPRPQRPHLAKLGPLLHQIQKSGLGRERPARHPTLHAPRLAGCHRTPPPPLGRPPLRHLQRNARPNQRLPRITPPPPRRRPSHARLRLPKPRRHHSRRHPQSPKARHQTQLRASKPCPNPSTNPSASPPPRMTSTSSSSTPKNTPPSPAAKSASAPGPAPPSPP